MANKTFNTRVKNKRDTAANWEAVATTFQPLDGELIIVDTSAGKTRFKVGRYDTAKGRLLYYNEIPFADEYLYNDLNESQGKIYDKLKGIDDKSIIEMTLEPSTGTAAVKQYNIGIWQFPKTGFYKIKLSQLGTNITFLRLYARKTKDDGTLPEDDFSNDNLVLTSGAGGDGQLEYIYILADYLDIDSLTAYKIQFLNPILKQGITWVNTYDKTTQKWSFASAANVNAKNVSSNLTLTKGDTKTVYDGSVAREISIPTKTSELTNDSNFTTQTDLDNLTNTVVSYNAQENITDEQKATARTNIGAISSSEVSSNYLSLEDTQELTEIQQDALKNKLGYINNLKVLLNWIEATELLKNAARYVLVIQNYTHNDGDTIPEYIGYPLLLIPDLITGTNQYFHLIDAYGDNYSCSFSYPSFKFDVSKNKMNQQTMRDDPTEDMQIATKKYVDNSSVQSDWNQNDATAKDYIKNRICYEKETVTELGNTAEVWHNLTNGLSSIPISYRMNGKIYKDLTAENGGGNDRIVYNGSVPEAYLVVVNYSSDVSQIILNYPSNVTDFQFVKIENTVKQIDPKFIPIDDTLDKYSENPVQNKVIFTTLVNIDKAISTNFVSINNQVFTDDQKQTARNNIGAASSSDLVQSDWNQNDTSSPAYIQNKPNIPKVDTELSTTSTNAIQNKAVKTAIDSLQTAIDGKVDTTALNYGLTQVTNDVAANYVKFTAEQTLTDEQKAQARDNINAPSPADAVYTATAASTDGVAYTATVSGIDSLTVGASFIMVPNKASASKAPTLNVNGLGAKPIRRRLSSLTTSLQQGYSTNWIALNKPFTVVYDGTAWVIEGLTKTDGADVYGAVAQATADAKGNNIADTYATIAMLQSMLPKVTTITLTSNWVGDASPYYQDIALSCVTETSIVDLQPTPEQLNSWQDDGIAFTTLSGNGTVRVYVAGGKPSSAISVQVRVQEVTVI